MLEGSGCWSSSVTLFRCLLLTLTNLLQLLSPPSLPPFLPPSFTHSRWLMHFSILPYLGQWRRPGETHKSKLKCSSECFLDMMHGSWDAAPALLLLHLLACWNTQIQSAGHDTTAKNPLAYLFNFTDLLLHVARRRRKKMERLCLNLLWFEFIFMLCRPAPIWEAEMHYQVRVYVEQGSGSRGVIPVSVVSCHVTLLQNWFLLSAFHQNIGHWRLSFPLLENDSLELTVCVSFQREGAWFCWDQRRMRHVCPLRWIKTSSLKVEFYVLLQLDTVNKHRQPQAVEKKKREGKKKKWILWRRPFLGLCGATGQGLHWAGTGVVL